MGLDPAASTAQQDALRQDLNNEYLALVKVVSEFDGRLMIVKGWSVTLSLASVGLGFQQAHYALFALAAVSAASFWVIDAGMKRHQMRYYGRMRDIEVATYHLSHLDLAGHTISSPLIDWSWGRSGDPSASTSEPAPRAPEDITSLLARAPWMGHVFLPHAVAAVIGLALFVCSVAGVTGLGVPRP